MCLKSVDICVCVLVLICMVQNNPRYTPQFEYRPPEPLTPEEQLDDNQERHLRELSRGNMKEVAKIEGSVSDRPTLQEQEQGRLEEQEEAEKAKKK